MKIFNRWGNLIFISTPHEQKWIGNNTSGKAMPEDVYFYIAEINGIVKKGSVQLLR